MQEEIKELRRLLAGIEGERRSPRRLVFSENMCMDEFMVYAPDAIESLLDKLEAQPSVSRDDRLLAAHEELNKAGYITDDELDAFKRELYEKERDEGARPLALLVRPCGEKLMIFRADQARGVSAVSVEWCREPTDLERKSVMQCMSNARYFKVEQPHQILDGGLWQMPTWIGASEWRILEVQDIEAQLTREHGPGELVKECGYWYWRLFEIDEDGDFVIRQPDQELWMDKEEVWVFESANPDDEPEFTELSDLICDLTDKYGQGSLENKEGVWVWRPEAALKTDAQKVEA